MHKLLNDTNYTHGMCESMAMQVISFHEIFVDPMRSYLFYDVYIFYLLGECARYKIWDKNVKAYIYIIIAIRIKIAYI